MTRIQWDVPGSRIFETGIDRGMLYVPPFSGVAWNGLVNVSETPSGGTAKEYYVDGEKYLGIPVLEEYAATVDSFSSPEEFASCAGFLRLSPGMLVSGQSRESFGFSYRTLTGDDIGGTSYGYKIHMVYNVLARVSKFTRESSGDKISVNPYSWVVTAVPEIVTMFKPVAHFSVDSRKLHPLTLAVIEDILYGTVTTDPRLPSAQELVAMAGP